MTHAMIGKNITHHSFEKKKPPASIYLVAKQLLLLCFHLEKDSNFILKVKRQKI